ncbi:MAG: archaeal proteasome endopeptidase complex subunit alpha [Candidatus Helarchaeota archaeon]
MMGFRDAGYDRTIMYSPDGRIIQVEYAREAVRRGSSVIAVRCPEGIVLLAESRSYSKLVAPNEKISQIEDNLFITFSGLLADARVLINEARVYAQVHKITYGEECDVDSVAWHLSKIAQKITQFGGRPFGLTVILAGINNSEPIISVVEPGGAKYDAKAIAIGKNESAIMDFLEQKYRDNMTLTEIKELTETAFKNTDSDKNNYELLIMDFKHQKIERRLMS